MRELLRADHLDTGYDGRTVLRDVNIQALRGQTICLIGPNGADRKSVV